jgi:hypothetical protein
MNSYKILALDETGKASFKHLSSVFLLSGLIISSNILGQFESDIKDLKLRFFNNENIVFHCRDMLRKKGVFSIFSDKQIENDFWENFIAIIDKHEIAIVMVITDKKKAKKIGWNDIAILKRSYSKVLEEFTKGHLSNSGNGRIISESDPYQDKYLLEAHNKLQSLGIPSEGISGRDYRAKMTSISLVNKLNLDTHIQTADNFAIMGRVFYKLKMKKIDINTLNETEKRFKDLIDKKLADKDNPSAFEALV